MHKIFNKLAILVSIIKNKLIKMLNFLKKLFIKKKLGKEKETIELNNLNGWFNAKSNAIYNNLNENIDIIKNEINSGIEKTKSNLESLKNAKLQNPNIPLRVKQIMEGNRQSYIKIISDFLNSIKIDNDHEKLLNYCKDFDEELNSLGKSTTRSYHVLREFFEHQATNIAINIKNLDNSVKKIK